MTQETQHTTETIALEAAGYFEQRTRSSGERYTATRDDRPAWLEALIFDAHDDFLPDDWKYQAIESALTAMADGEDDGGQWASEYADVYTSELLEWLGSHLLRSGYCDAAAEELGADGLELTDRIGLGQQYEAMQIWQSVAQSLADRLDELED